MKHKHRIIPGHMGGKYTPDNIKMVTIEEHANEHLKLYEQYGHWQDFVAWKALSGQIGKEEIIHLVISMANKGKIPWNKGILGNKRSEETKNKIRNSHYGIKPSEESKQKNKEKHLGKNHTEEAKQKISIALKDKPKPPRTDEHRKNISSSMRGKPWSEKRRLAQRKDYVA